MPVPSSIADLSQTPNSNYPTGAESPITADNYLREYAAYIAQLRDGKNFADPVTLASATTTDIGAQNSMFVEITGTTTITGLGTTYNGPRFLRFTGILLLTHNATTLNLPGAANITTAAGDTAIAVPNSTPNGWNIVSFNKASGAPLFASSAGADIASAATLDLTARTGNIVRITGTTATTAVTLSNGDQVWCYAVGAWPLTYNVTTMPTPGGVSYTCATGDVVIFSKDGSGVITVDIIPKSGQPVAQVATAKIADAAVTPAKLSQPFTAGTAVATTSGTAIDFTGIPSWVKRITVIFNQVSTSGTSPLQVQIGSGSVDTSGYTSFADQAATRQSSTSGFVLIRALGDSDACMGHLVITSVGSGNGWVASGILAPSVTATNAYMGGAKTLAGALDRIRLTTIGGADTFDAGVVNILYE